MNPSPGSLWKGLFWPPAAATCVFDWCSMLEMESLSTGVESPVDKEENRCSWGAIENASINGRGFAIRP